VREQFLPFSIPTIDSEEIDAVAHVLRSGWLTTGPVAHSFERAFADYIGVRHAVALNSGTAALHLALDAIGLKVGDEVIVPVMTFAATAEVVLYFNARPVLVDCEPDTLNMDPEAVERAITPRTRAIIPVHVGGQPCDMDRLLEIARRHGLKVIEDAAHALPARYKGRLVGTIADITCFSFYSTKTITTGEGGMVTTADDAYAERMRIMSLHGINRDAWKRYTAEGSWFYEVVRAGFKYNLTDVAAALGVVQLRKCDGFWASRRRLAARYHELLAGTPEVRVPAVRPDVEHAWHLYVVQLDSERLAIGRDAFIAALKERKIGASVHFIPLHLHPFYRDTFGYKPGDFPVAYGAYQRIISLPLYPRMTDADLGDVAEAVHAIAAAHRR